MIFPLVISKSIQALHGNVIYLILEMAPFRIAERRGRSPGGHIPDILDSKVLKIRRMISNIHEDHAKLTLNA